MTGAEQVVAVLKVQRIKEVVARPSEDGSYYVAGV